MTAEPIIGQLYSYADVGPGNSDVDYRYVTAEQTEQDATT